MPVAAPVVEVGGHCAFVEEKDDARYLLYKYGTDFEDVAALVAFHKQVHVALQALSPRPVGVIVDQSSESGKRPGPEARKAMMSGDVLENMFAIAFFGADFPIRSLSTLLIKGARLMGRIPGDVPVVFLKSAEEAWLWMAERDKSIGQTTS